MKEEKLPQWAEHDGMGNASFDHSTRESRMRGLDRMEPVSWSTKLAMLFLIVLVLAMIFGVFGYIEG